MNPDEKITPIETDDNRSDSSGDLTAEQPVLPENDFHAQNQPLDQALLNIQSTSASSQDVQSKSSEIIHVSQELNLQTENQSPANSPQSTSQCVKSNLEDTGLTMDESCISSEQNFQFKIQPPASQSASIVKCADDTISIQSVHVEIHISPQSEHSEAENRAKEDKNIVIKRAEDAIEELSSDALPSPTNPSSPEVEKKKVEVSRIKQFFDKRIEIAHEQMSRADCFILLILTSIAEIVCIFLYLLANLGDDDALLSYIIGNPICWLIGLFMEKELLTTQFYSLCPCCEHNEAESAVKQSQRAPPVEDSLFKHEVVDVENINPQDSPGIFGKKQERSDAFSFPSEIPSIGSANVHEENVTEVAYDPIFASGACGYSPGLREVCGDTHYTDCFPESQRVIAVEVHKETNESAENPAEVVKKYPSRRDNSSESEGEKTTDDP